MPQGEQGVELTGQLEDDVELVARHLGRVLSGVDAKIEGVRTDFQVMLLEEVAKLIRRFERMEALLAERFGDELVAELHRALAASDG